MVRELQPDLVHAHGSKAGVIARLARLAYPRTPVVFTPHLYAFDNYFARPPNAASIVRSSEHLRPRRLA